MDQFLKKRLINYEKWIDDETISYSSKVIPIAESVDITQWVLPMEQALSILKNAKSFALAKCVCRRHYRRCDHPVEVCFVINAQAEKDVKNGDARYITLEEAADVITIANKNGLVHLSLYRPDHEIFALCNCCPCCCHDLQLLMKYGRDELICHADYVASTDMDLCTHCGECVDRCHFDARQLNNEKLNYDINKCYGCGLCVVTCPTGAIVMQKSG
jgi:ferredoxin